MSERPVEIPVSKTLRDKIKKLKGKLTYEEFFNDLIKKDEDLPKSPKTHSKQPRKEMTC